MMFSSSLLGVRQGGPESPPLYNLYMDYVMRVFMQKCEENNVKFLKLKYRIRATATTRGEHTVDWAGYADDLELAFESISDLEKGLKILHETFVRFHLQINAKKTKTMIINFKSENQDEYPQSIVMLNDHVIENVELFRYLGDDIHYTPPSRRCRN